MKSKVFNRSLLAGVVISLCSGLLAPAALAACAGTELSACPAPFDAQLPDTHKMLTW
ncbi:serine hydrolase, partial [Klebsiella pneumoniae]|nr:serine hydrolase [Klebsiella pneumoniae]